MNDFLTRLIPGILYALLILGCLTYSQFSFVILMFIFCVIIIFEYGKVLRKDSEHSELISILSIKYKQAKYGHVFLNTEFPILSCFFILSGFGIYSILNNYESSSFYELIILFFSIVISSILIYFILNNKSLFNSKKIKTWPLTGIISSFLLIIYSSISHD